MTPYYVYKFLIMSPTITLRAQRAIARENSKIHTPTEFSAAKSLIRLKNSANVGPPISGPNTRSRSKLTQ